jgi:hypothetical protein
MSDESGLRAEIALLRALTAPECDLVDQYRAENDQLLAALKAAGGYLMNAKIDLETGAPKRTAIRTIEGGLSLVEAALARAAQRSNKCDG